MILQRKTAQAAKDKSVFSRIEVKTDPSKPNPGIFSRAVRTAIGGENTRIVIKKDEPQIQFESDSDIDEDSLLEDSGNIATVMNLPHGMTDTRLKTLAGNDVQVTLNAGFLCLMLVLRMIHLFGSNLVNCDLYFRALSAVVLGECFATKTVMFSS